MTASLAKCYIGFIGFNAEHFVPIIFPYIYKTAIHLRFLENNEKGMQQSLKIFHSLFNKKSSINPSPQGSVCNFFYRLSYTLYLEDMNNCDMLWVDGSSNQGTYEKIKILQNTTKNANIPIAIIFSKRKELSEIFINNENVIFIELTEEGGVKVVPLPSSSPIAIDRCMRILGESNIQI